MRDPKRIEPMLKLIKEIWCQYPDLRLLQLIINHLNEDMALYYIEDDEIYKALKKYKNLMEG